MRAERLSPGITPWDEWYHAIASWRCLARKGGAGFVTVHRAGQGMRSGQLGRGTRASTLVMAGDAFAARVVSRDSKSGIGPGGRIAAFVPRLLRSHRNEENPSIGSAAMSLRLPDR